MVSAWYLNPPSPSASASESDPRLPHKFQPNREVSLEELQKLGVEYFNVDVTKDTFMDDIEAICKQRGYKVGGG